MVMIIKKIAEINLQRVKKKKGREVYLKIVFQEFASVRSQSGCGRNLKIENNMRSLPYSYSEC